MWAFHSQEKSETWILNKSSYFDYSTLDYMTTSTKQLHESRELAKWDGQNKIWLSEDLNDKLEQRRGLNESLLQGYSHGFFGKPWDGMEKGPQSGAHRWLLQLCTENRKERRRGKVWKMLGGTWETAGRRDWPWKEKGEVIQSSLCLNMHYLCSSFFPFFFFLNIRLCFSFIYSTKER